MTATATALAVVLGTGAPSLSIVFLMLALISGAVGIGAWRAQQAVHDVASLDTLWWKFLVAGVSMVAATFAGMAIPWPDAIELGDNAYWLVVISLMTGFMLGALGLALAMAAFIRHHHHTQSAPGAT